MHLIGLPATLVARSSDRCLPTLYMDRLDQLIYDPTPDGNVFSRNSRIVLPVGKDSPHVWEASSRGIYQLLSTSYRYGPAKLRQLLKDLYPTGRPATVDSHWAPVSNSPFDIEHAMRWVNYFDTHSIDALTDSIRVKLLAKGMHLIPDCAAFDQQFYESNQRISGDVGKSFKHLRCGWFLNGKVIRKSLIEPIG